MEEGRARVSPPEDLPKSPSSLAGEKAESCAVCRTKLSFSSEPKLLPCLHMVCKGCTVNTSVGNNAKECPVCGHSFHLSEVTDCYIFEDSAPKCGGCEESVLTGWCQECEEALCSDCVSAHQRVKVTRNHTVIPKKPQSGLSISLRCTSHKQEQLKFFCVTCDQLTCRDCQLIDHRNHSFLCLNEAVVSHKEQLMKLLDSISEQKNSVRARRQDLDGRLNNIKELQASSEKQLQRVLHSLYISLMLRCQQLSKELAGLCEGEENSLKLIMMSLKKLEDRQEYITAFLHKILSTEGHYALRHKKQIEKCAQRVLSQNKPLPDTVIQLSFELNEHSCNIIKNFGSLKVTRVPLPDKKKCSNGNKPKNTSKDTEKPSGLNSESGATLSTSDTTSTQATASSMSQAAFDLSQCGLSESASSKPVPPTQGLIDPKSHSSSSPVSHTFAPPKNNKSNLTQYVVTQKGQHLPQCVPPQASQLQQSEPVSSNPVQPTQGLIETISHSSSTSVSHTFASPKNNKSNMTQYVVPQTGQLLLQSLPPQISQLQQSESASSKPVQPTRGLIDTMSHSSSKSVSLTFAPPKNSKSNMTQYVVTQTGQHLPQSLPPRTSQLVQVFSSLAHQTVSKINPSNCPQQDTGRPKVLLSKSNSGAVLAALPALTSCPPVLVQTFSTQSSHVGSITNTHSLSSKQFVPPVITLAPVAQSIQVISNPQPSTVNFSFNHTQQSISQSQTFSGQAFPSQTAPKYKLVHYSPAVSCTQSVNVQPPPSAGTQSNHLLTLLTKVPNNTASLNSRKPLKFYHCTPVMTVNKGTNLTYATQPAPGLTTVPGSNNKVVEHPAPSTPPLTAALITIAHSNAGLIECGTQTIQMPKSELPVKAPADSVCEGDINVYSRSSPIAEESDSNLPTSTVPEKDTRAREGSAVYQAQDSPSTSSIKDCPTNQSLAKQSKLSLKSISNLASTRNPSTKHWLMGLPSTFREILSGEKKVLPDDACSRSTLEHASVHNLKDEENTDDSDSELVKEMDDLEEEPILGPENNKTLHVSLVRLPIPGSSLSRFRVVPNSQKDKILLQEIKENQSIQRGIRIAAPPDAASPPHSGSSECSMQGDVLDCAVCLSAGASLQCAECGRSFHTSCHVPPIIFSPTATWVCSLCQDMLDDTDPFRCNRLEEPYLSVPDQRRCEQLLLTLMCEEHNYLLYKCIKQPANCVEFNLIIGRLLGKYHPPYRSAAEMVSDLWALFHNLSSNSKKKDLVVKLQSSFQKRLSVSFGKSLHASLLTPLSSKDHTGAPETKNQEKAKNTLKRMRAFLDANCTLVTKKSRSEDT